MLSKYSTLLLNKIETKHEKINKPEGKKNRPTLIEEIGKVKTPLTRNLSKCIEKDIKIKRSKSEKLRNNNMLDIDDNIIDTKNTLYAIFTLIMTCLLLFISSLRYFM